MPTAISLPPNQWALKKTDPKRMETVLYVTAEVVRQCAILAQPAMPGLAPKLLELLAVEPSGRTFASLGPNGRLKPGTPIPEPQGVFPRYVDPEEAGKAPQGKPPKKEKSAKA